MDVPLSLAAVLLLVAANGFFVATEFALVAVRRTRMEHLAASGNRSARSVLGALNHLDAYIAATQLGITMSSLALGWIGEPAVGQLIEPVVLAIPLLPEGARSAASHTISASLAFAVITALHIVLGELTPKSLALQRAEATALWVVRPIRLFYAVFRWPISALNALGNAVVRLAGIQPATGHSQVHSADELKLAISASRRAGLVAEGTEEIIERALDFSGFAAHHLMVPRTEITAVPLDVPLARLVAIVHKYQHSRYPVFHGNVDNVIGVLSAKRLLGPVISARDHEFTLRDHMTPPLFVPESLPAHHLLAQMRRHRAHMAIVIDEYGVTAGLVTLRDLIARIAGDLPDETESASPAIAWLDDGSALVGGLTLLSDIENQIGVQFAETEVDTLGGLIFDWLGRRPVLGDSISVQGYSFTIQEMDGLRIAQVRLRRAQDEIADARGRIPPAFISHGAGD